MRNQDKRGRHEHPFFIIRMASLERQRTREQPRLDTTDSQTGTAERRQQAPQDRATGTPERPLKAAWGFGGEAPDCRGLRGRSPLF